MQALENNQRQRRWLWRGTAEQFKSEINRCLDDELGDESTMLQICSRKGNTRLLWSWRVGKRR